MNEAKRQEYERLARDIRAWAKEDGPVPHDQLLADAADAIAELMAERRWIPVRERLPEDGVRVLIYNLFGPRTGTKSGAVWFNDNDRPIPVTHWMPLPDDPAAESAAAGGGEGRVKP
jgi:hypothetical protein